MKTTRILIMTLALLVLVAGCSREEQILTPQASDTDLVYNADKNGTETLGTPSIAIATGSGFAGGGVGMVGVASGTLEIAVPMGATVNQALLYWAGGTTGAPGDDAIMVDGTEIQGELIGGPVNFFSANGSQYFFSGYRADITQMGIVVPGANSFEITGFDFDFTGGPLDENNGASILVIYDDGTAAELGLVDGLDMAFFKFAPTLNATVPQTFSFGAEMADRMADLVVIAGSVGEGRPNQVKVTTTAGDQFFTDVLGSEDGLLWDSIILAVNIPAGDTSLTVELISTDSEDPLGASLGWLASGLAVPVTPPLLACIGDYVWHDMNMDGIQDMDEMGVEGVVVHLMDCAGNTLDETMTDANGHYMFCDLNAGDYNIHFVLPADHVFSPQDQGMDDARDSDADPATGLTICTTLDPGENDWTWDAGIYVPEQRDGCSLTIGYWKTHAGFGPQDDMVTALLPLWLGDMGGAKSIEVTDAAQAVALLKTKDFGGNSNGIAKLYAQLLGTKLNLANGASADAVAAEITAADAFLADHDWMDWENLSDDDQQMVLAWMEHFDDYNNGLIGPGHCDDDDDDNDFQMTR